MQSSKFKTVVFGGSGFLGGHVADTLSERGHQVTLFDLRPSHVLRPDQKMMVSDVLDFEAVKKAVEGATYVYNFSGMAGLKDCMFDPRRAIETNIMGNTNILEACRNNNIKRYVFASSVYVYSDLAPFYKSSKQACELIIEDYQKSYGPDFTILRYGSLYGTRANHFNTIHNLIQGALRDGRITHYGQQDDVREYIHVLDAARSSVDILDDAYKNEYIMLTGTQSIQVKDLLRLINEVLGGHLEIEFKDLGHNAHYGMAPYSFRPKVAKKLLSNFYHDLGQGILEVIHEVYAQGLQDPTPSLEANKPTPTN